MHPLRYAIAPDDRGPLVLGIASDGDHVVAVGGQGRDFYMMSEDGGRTFEPRESPGRGLRSAWVNGDDVWVCGEYGYAAHSPDRGRTWHVLETGASACLFGVGVIDGELYLAGDDGFLIRVDRDGAVEYIELTTVGYSRFSPHPGGFLLPSDSPGQLWVVGPGKPRKMRINAGVSLMKARVLASGTILVVGGDGSVFRSSDDGHTFRQVEGEFSGLLCGVESLGDEVYVVGQDRQLWRSTDDGQTFTAVEHDLGSGYLWCCERVGDVLMIGCHQGAVIQLGEFSGAATTLAPQGEVGPAQPLQTRPRGSTGRSRHKYLRLSDYVSGGTFAEEVAEFLHDQPRATPPPTPADMAAAYACLGADPREEVRALQERYAAGAVPEFEGLEVRLGRRVDLPFEKLEAELAAAYGEEDAHALAATVLESVELLGTDGLSLLVAHDGIWEWDEAVFGLRRVCDDIGTLFHLLVRAAAARLGRFEREALVEALDTYYDDWLDLEFFETSVEG